MSVNRGKGMKRNERKISHEGPTKTPRINLEEQVQAVDEIQDQGQPIPLSSPPSYGKIQTLGISRIYMDFEGETGNSLKESFIESIQSCPTDLDLICSDGVTSVHRFILMGVSKFLFRLLRDRDIKDTEAITLDSVSIDHLSLALDLIYSGVTTAKENDENGLQEVLNLLEIEMQLERKEATEEELPMQDTLQEEEIIVKYEYVYVDNEMQTEEDNGETSGNEAENTNASTNNASTVVEEVGVIDDDFGSATDNETEMGEQMEAGPGQLDIREPQTGGQITLNGKQIGWHLMEAVPSLTSPELLPERMRVFNLNIINRPSKSLHADLRNLFESLPESSLEKRLGMMAVQCENYQEMDLVEILQPSKAKGVPACQDKYLRIEDLELVGIPSECANVVRRMPFDARKSTSKPTVTLKYGMLNDESARYNLVNYEKIIYGNTDIQADKLLEIRNMEGLEDRAKAIINLKVAGRTVTIHRFMGPHFGWHEDYVKRFAPGIFTEIGGIGWDVWSYKGKSDFSFGTIGTQILFPTLVKDVDLAKKVVVGQIGKVPSSPSLCHGVAVSPKCLLENGISLFPVVQKPGMLIYKHNDKDKLRRDISKLRLGIGAEMHLCDTRGQHYQHFVV